MRARRLQLVAALAAATATSGVGQTGLPDFGKLSLDQLANVKITSFTNKEQKLSQVAGAVYVITREQIERSGLTSVPELLRLAPGIDVARINGNQWSISARGPVGAYANKLLVLIDGRSIYSPVFSGVYWEMGMPTLGNIERIEVIRGPGATVWGANAVLGVINIITKNSSETHGTTVTAGGGTSERGFGNVTTGGAIGSTNYRVYAGGLNQAPLSQASGAQADDELSTLQGGFRLDGSHKNDTWMLEGDIFRGDENDTGIYASLPSRSSFESPSQFNSYAGNLTGEWRRQIGKAGELRIKSYFDYVNRPGTQASKVESRKWDTEIQYDFTAGHIHNFSVGGGERLISIDAKPTAGFSFTPAKLTYSDINAFAQDEMHFAHDALLITIGAKLERNHFGGWGAEPSANLLWMPAQNHTVWISGARSHRTPAIVDTGIAGPYTVLPPSAASGGLPTVVSFKASPAFSTESVNDFEVGYRAQISKSFSTDLSLFYNQFYDIRSAFPGKPVVAFSNGAYLSVPLMVGNGVGGTGKGGEASLAWRILPAWKLEGSYTYALIDFWLNSSAPPGAMSASSKVPSRNKWRLQSYVNLSKSWQLDVFLYWTSAGSPTNGFGPDIPVPSYTRLDVRLGYKVNAHWQFSLAGQNLLQARHLEAVAELASAQSYVTRGVILKSTWEF